MKGLKYLSTLKPWTGEGKFSLRPMEELVQALGNPQDKIRSIHVAGTNGKGSVCAYIASILGNAGYSVSLNVSPHLVRQNERIVIDGLSISDQELNECAEEVSKAADRCGVEPSYFEAITACFFLESVRRNVQWMVVEVGLGGRLDATNVLKNPDISIISTIDFDHCDILGNTLSEIAVEKSGIIRTKGKVISGETKEEPARVIRNKCRELNATLNCLGSEFNYESRGTATFYRDGGSSFPFKPSLKGRHQLANAAVAINAVRSLGVGEDECTQGVSEVYWPCRLEEVDLGRDRVVIFEAAHNIAGINSLVSYLIDSGFSSLPIGFGALRTKNWREMVDVLFPFASEWGVLEPDSQMSTPADEICSYLRSKGARVESYGRDYSAFIENFLLSVQKYPIIVAGSIYLIGKLRKDLGVEERPIWAKREK